MYTLSTRSATAQSISYGIVQKHGGEITVASDPRKGTEFLVKVPIAGPPDEKSQKAIKV